MSWITARRRHPAAGYAVVLLGLLIAGVLYAAITGSGAPAVASAPTAALRAQITSGAQLFSQNCASCHGQFAQGTSQAPSLIGVGSAAVDFQVSTGRMPAAETGAENPRKPLRPPFGLTNGQPHTRNIRAVAAYIQSLGGGPQIPSAAQVSQSGADIGLGEQLFEANCSQCHNFVGAGGALTYGKYAPPLTDSTPTQIYEAMLTGPEAMPVFGDSSITPQEKRDIIAYVVQTRQEPNPGGFSLGRVGPVTEGLVAFLGMLLFMVFGAMWITARHGKPHE